jgi:RNA polymerase sigma factor (sigma-70 family)
MAPRTATALEEIFRTAGGGVASTTDRELIRRFADAGDQAAFATLFRRHAGMVFGVCRRALANLQDAEDACQATFLVLARKAHSRHWQPSLSNWLYTTARRVAQNARIAAERRARREGRAAVPEAVEPVDRMTGRELLAVLDEELDKLPPHYREPLVLCYLQGLTRDEAATRLGVPPATLKSHLERGRKRLGDALTKRGCLAGAGLLALAATSTAGPSPRLVEGVLIATSGAAPAAVAVLARDVALKQLVNKSAVVLLLLAGTAALALGLVSAAVRSPHKPPSEHAAGVVQPKVNRPAVDEAIPGHRAKPADKPEPPVDRPAPRPISGHVIGRDGKPVAGANLFVSTTKATRVMWPFDYQVSLAGTADVDGRFAVTVIPSHGNLPRPYLLAYAPGFGLDWLQFPGPYDPELAVEHTFHLPADVPIRGRVVTTEGKPAAGVTVAVTGVTEFERLDDFLRIYQGDPNHFSQGTGARRLTLPLNDVLGVKLSDKDGRFEIRGIGVARLAALEVKGTAVAASRFLVVTRSDFDAKAYLKGVMGGPGERMPLFGPSFEHVVQRAVEVEGVVREAGTGKPLAGAAIHARGAEALTDSQGHYRLSGMFKETRGYLLYVAAPENVPLVTRSVNIPSAADQQPIRADVELTRGVVVTGRVYDKATGKCVPECLVHFVPLPDNKAANTNNKAGLAFLGVSDADGRYRLVAIPGPGVVLVQVPHTLLEIDGVPIGTYKPAEFDAADRPRITMTDQVKPLRTFVTASGLEVLDSSIACKVLDLKDDGTAVSCDLAVDPGKTLTVNLLDPEGKLLAGAVAAGVSPQFWLTRKMVPFKTGSGRIYALDPDKPRPVVFLHAERKLAALVTLRGDEEQPMTVKLASAAVITGRALDEDGQPLAGAEIFTLYSTPVGQSLTNSRDRNLLPQTDKEGRFRLEGTVPGLPLELALRKGRQMLVPEKRLQIKPLESGQTLDLGDLRTKPRG